MTTSARSGPICTLTPIRALVVPRTLWHEVELQVPIRAIGGAPLSPANPGAILNELSIAIREIRGAVEAITQSFSNWEGHVFGGSARFPIQVIGLAGNKRLSRGERRLHPGILRRGSVALRDLRSWDADFVHQGPAGVLQSQFQGTGAADPGDPDSYRGRRNRRARYGKGFTHSFGSGNVLGGTDPSLDISDPFRDPIRKIQLVDRR